MKNLHYDLWLTSLVWLCAGQDVRYYFKSYKVSLDGLSGDATVILFKIKRVLFGLPVVMGLNRFDGNTFKSSESNMVTLPALAMMRYRLYMRLKMKTMIGTHIEHTFTTLFTERFTAFKLIPPGEVRMLRGDYNCTGYR